MKTKTMYQDNYDEYDKITYNSRFYLKRVLHKKRFTDAVKLLKPSYNDIVLDYGSGDGQFVVVFRELFPENTIFAYEPATSMFNLLKEKVINLNINVVNMFPEIENNKFSKITCLEVCEHLNDRNLTSLIENIKHILDENGQILISVPIEIGISSFFKNIFRLVKSHGDYSNLTFQNLINALLCRSVNRSENQKLSGLDYYFSHVGFNHKSFIKIIQNHFRIIKIYYSPINFLKGFLNNSIYLVCVNIS